MEVQLDGLGGRRPYTRADLTHSYYPFGNCYSHTGTTDQLDQFPTKSTLAWKIPEAPPSFALHVDRARESSRSEPGSPGATQVHGKTLAASGRCIKGITPATPAGSWRAHLSAHDTTIRGRVPTRVQRRARVAYELTRVRLALLGVAPVAVIVAVAACVAHRPASTLGFGVATIAVGAAMLWYGRDPQRAVLPGIVAGLVPLVLALCAKNMHSCGPAMCSNFCVPVCTLGGVVAGLAVASVGNQRRAGVWFWLSASGLALLTGSTGCACVGYSGVVGLGVGFAAGIVPGLLSRATRKKTS